MPHKDVPLFGIISRLADQKGFDLIYEVMDEIMKLDLQFVLLGTGEPKYHLMFERIKEKYPRKAGINLGFDAALAQRIYAGSDVFMMPSRYEPCGLGQLISYATAPFPWCDALAVFTTRLSTIMTRRRATVSLSPTTSRRPY